MNGWGCRWVWFGMNTSIDGWSVCGAGRLTWKVEKRTPKKKEACQKDKCPAGAALVVEQSHVFLAPTPWTQQCHVRDLKATWRSGGGRDGCVDSLSLQLSYPKSQWNPGAACFRPAQALKLDLANALAEVSIWKGTMKKSVVIEKGTNAKNRSWCHAGYPMGVRYLMDYPLNMSIHCAVMDCRSAQHHLNWECLSDFAGLCRAFPGFYVWNCQFASMIQISIDSL